MKEREEHMHHLETENEREEEEYEEYEEVTLYSLNEATANNRFKIDLRLNGKNITFDIDTGATMSVISERTHAQHFYEVPLQKTNIVLKSYDGACIKPLGAMCATIQHNDENVPCVFLVIRNGGQPLIGRDNLDKFKFEFACNSLSVINVSKLIDKYH